MATIPHRTIMSPTQDHLAFSVRKSLFHLFDYYFDGKQELGLLEMNLIGAFHSCESRWLLAGVLHWNRWKTGSRAAADVLWHVTVPGLHWRILSPRHELNYGGLHDIMIMSLRSWLTQSGQKKLLCLKIKKCSLKILITGLIYLIKDSWNEMKCQSEMLI